MMRRAGFRHHRRRNPYTEVQVVVAIGVEEADVGRRPRRCATTCFPAT